MTYQCRHFFGLSLWRACVLLLGALHHTSALLRAPAAAPSASPAAAPFAAPPPLGGAASPSAAPIGQLDGGPPPPPPSAGGPPTGPQAGPPPPRVPSTVYDKNGLDWTDGMCFSRERQSPVNFDDHIKDPPSDVLKYHYEPIRNVKLTMKAQKGLIYVDTSDLQVGEVVFGGELYPLVRIDFHANSEHLLKGKRFAMELQLVHRKRTDPTKSLIISVPVWSEKVPTPPPVPLVSFVKKPLGTYFPPLETEPDFNAVLQQFLTVRPPWKEGMTSDIVIPLMKPLDLGFFIANPNIPGTGEYIQYAGSLTTPPCSDVTTWFVRRRPMIASDSQTQAFAESVFKLTNKHGNFRAVMPVNQRILRVYKAQWVQNLPMYRNPLPLGPNARTDEEFKAEKLADMAKQLSQDSVDYMADFGNRLRRSARKLQKNIAKADTLLRAGPTEPPKLDEWDQAVMKMQSAMETIVGGVKDQVDHDFRHETMRIHKQAAIEGEKARELSTAWTAPDGRSQGVA